MTDSDPIAEAFARIRAQHIGGVRPPGIDVVRRTVRHRRAVRAAMASVLALVAVGLTPLLLADQPKDKSPTDDATPSVSASPSPSASPGPTATGTIPVAGGPGPGGNTKCAADGIATIKDREGLAFTLKFIPSTGTSSASASASAEPTEEPEEPVEPPTATPSTSASASTPPPASTGNTRVPCGSLRVPVFWASYVKDAEGNLTLYKSDEFDLRQRRTEWDLEVSAPDCGVWFVGHDQQSIPESIPKDVGRPFWDEKHDRDGVLASGETDCPPVTAPTVTPSS